MATVYGSAAEGDQDAEWTAYHSYRAAPTAQSFWLSLRSNSGLKDLEGGTFIYSLPHKHICLCIFASRERE